MVRKAEFDDNSFIQAAIELVAMGGPAAATMAAIAKCADAPTGSIYHRFTSRTALLAAAWYHCLGAMTEEITPHLTEGRSDSAIAALIDWAENNPTMARVIMLYSENDLIDGDLSAELHKKLNQVNQQLGAGLSALLAHKQKSLSTSNLALANFAIFDGPIAALRPLLRGHPTASSLNSGKCRAAALACARASLDLLD